jgi:hypothetical protein
VVGGKGGGVGSPCLVPNFATDRATVGMSGGHCELGGGGGGGLTCLSPNLKKWASGGGGGLG